MRLKEKEKNENYISAYFVDYRYKASANKIDDSNYKNCSFNQNISTPQTKENVNDIIKEDESNYKAGEIKYKKRSVKGKKKRNFVFAVILLVLLIISICIIVTLVSSFFL